MGRIILALCCLPHILSAATATGITVNPATVAFSWQTGTTLPAALNVAVASGGTATTFTVTVAAGPWLTVTPLTGTTPASLKVTTNPTSLPIGSYSGTITVTPSGTFSAVQVAVSLTVKAPAAALSVTPATLSVTCQVGDPTPAAQILSLASGEGLVSFTAASAGGTWLSVAPSSGVVFLVFPAQLSVSITPDGLPPGTYKGTVTISSTTASTKTLTVPVTLTVNPAMPAITFVWPDRIPVGSADTTVTISGTGFFGGSTVKANGTTLKSTLLGSTAITAVIPTASLATAGILPVIVSNPTPGGGDSPAYGVTVQTLGPHLASNGIVNAASYVGGTVSPGEMVAIFGSGLGPAALAVFTAPPSGTLDTTLAGVQVFFDSTPAPLIYAQSGQIGAVAPYAIAGQISTQVYVVYNGNSSETVTVNVVDASPGIFTLGAAGMGQCAALNYNDTTKAYTINADTNGAPAGTIVVLYATGAGQTTPAGKDGEVVSPLTTPLPTPVLPVSVQIAGVDAAVLSATAAPGLVAGVLQVNVKVPDGLKALKAAPVVLKVGTFTSQPGATISIK